MDIEYFLKSKVQANQCEGILRTKDLYKDIDNEYLKHLFAIMHQEFNRLYKFMESKKKSNGHFNAAESRSLLNYINLYKDMEYTLKGTPYSFNMEKRYVEMANLCCSFLLESNGSEIPKDLPQFEIIEYDPIFSITQSVQVKSPNKSANIQLTLIGGGSYANVYKYRDEFYNKDFVIKRAKSNLTAKELERFAMEYETMKKLKSPYVLDVYRYDSTKNEYYMEYADETLKVFIDKNNTKLSLAKRKGIARQIFKGFSYIHSKRFLHRDISFTNILLQHYDDDLSIVKISDFGLVKLEMSNLTSFGTEIKGSLNDSNLQIIGFDNYKMEYETFALTRLIYYLMTGKSNLENISDDKIKEFVLKGVNQHIEKRYSSVAEMQSAFENTF